jgi:hypothetical protein
VLRDETCTLAEFIRTATEDCQEAVRLVPIALRKGPALLALAKAVETGSAVARQEAIAAFTEKRIASITMAALRSTDSRDPKDLAYAVADSLIQTLVDQIATRAKRVQRFCSATEQAELRRGLTREFRAHLPVLSKTIEASLRGEPVRRIRRPTAKVRMAPGDVARMSLLPPSASLEHAHGR